MSVEEPAPSEEAKDNEAKKKADEEEQKETGDKEDEHAEEIKVETMDTLVPDEIKKEESTDGKSKCCYMCHVAFQVHMKAYSLFQAVINENTSLMQLLSIYFT